MYNSTTILYDLTSLADNEVKIICCLHEYVDTIPELNNLLGAWFIPVIFRYLYLLEKENCY